MKKFRIFLKIFFAIVIVLVIAITVFINHLKPDYSGEIKLKNIEQETTVYFDDYGIPHVPVIEGDRVDKRTVKEKRGDAIPKFE